MLGLELRAAWLAPLAVGQAACLIPAVPEDRYADAAAVRPGTSVLEDAATSDADAHRDAGSLWLDAGGFPEDAGVFADAAPLPPTADCDFSGRWLVTERLVASGLGIQQASLWWLYLEVQQSGDFLRVQRGLICGTGGRQVGSLGVTVDMHQTWPALQQHNDPAGRTGRATLESGRCALRWERFYRVLGATMPYYEDPSRPLPSADTKAAGDKPGWEDWDRDGQPGVSIHVSGVLSGTRYSTSRTWTSYAGQVPSNARNFRLPLDWNQEEQILGVSSDALKAPGSKDGDASLHFAQFASLADTQATGSDDQICAAIRDLAPELTADAY